MYEFWVFFKAGDGPAPYHRVWADSIDAVRRSFPNAERIHQVG